MTRSLNEPGSVCAAKYRVFLRERSKLREDGVTLDAIIAGNSWANVRRLSSHRLECYEGAVDEVLVGSLFFS
jgi:hypothetical protein